MKRFIVTAALAVLSLARPADAQTAAASPAPSPATTAAAASNPAIDARMRKQWADSAAGVIDRKQYDDKMNGLMTADGIKKLAAALTSLGVPTAFTPLEHSTIGSSSVSIYRVTTPQGLVDMSLSLDGSGKIDGLWYRPAPAP